MTHICVNKPTIIGSDNGLSPGRRQAIIWTNAGILLIWTLGTNFSEILGKIHSFSFKKMHLKMSSTKGRLFSPGLNELKPQWVDPFAHGWCHCYCILIIFKLISRLDILIISGGIALRWMPQDLNIVIMISQHWFFRRLGAIRQQAIAWTNVDKVLWLHIWHHLATMSSGNYDHADNSSIPELIMLLMWRPEFIVLKFIYLFNLLHILFVLRDVFEFVWIMFPLLCIVKKGNKKKTKKQQLQIHPEAWK